MRSFPNFSQVAPPCPCAATRGPAAFGTCASGLPGALDGLGLAPRRTPGTRLVAGGLQSFLRGLLLRFCSAPQRGWRIPVIQIGLLRGVVHKGDDATVDEGEMKLQNLQPSNKIMDECSECQAMFPVRLRSVYGN